MVSSTFEPMGIRSLFIYITDHAYSPREGLMHLMDFRCGRPSRLHSSLGIVSYNSFFPLSQDSGNKQEPAERVGPNRDETWISTVLSVMPNCLVFS